MKNQEHYQKLLVSLKAARAAMQEKLKTDPAFKERHRENMKKAGLASSKKRQETREKLAAAEKRLAELESQNDSVVDK